jgi:hypothetical protein
LKNSLRWDFRGRDLDQPPVAQHVFVDFGPDPVHGERHQPHADRGVEALDGFHQAYIALLHQIAHGQPVAEIPARDVHDEPQVRQHQVPRGIEITLAPKAGGQRHLVFLGQDRDLRDTVDISVQAPDGAREYQSSLFSD